MIPKECKRLAEVDFPIAAVSAHSAREKSIRHGHPSTLHLWWARRPLAACRSMLMALLLPDPCDPHCPPAFKDAARRILLEFPGRPGRWDRELDPKNGKTADAAMRRALLHEFIADFANWDNAANPAYLKTARALVKAAHGDEAPLVVDPFAGGGAIPLEALRIGCDAFASDLNPVACLINKVLLEDIPRHGPKLVEELRRVGAEIKRQAEKELAEFYPSDRNGAHPIAYLWARTVRCEQPNCGCEIPLARSFWLSKKGTRRCALRYEVSRQRGVSPSICFEVFKPDADGDVPRGTVSRAKAICPACNVALLPERVRSQLADQRGGSDVTFDGKGQRVGGAVLLAVVLLSPEQRGRSYRIAEKHDYEAVRRSVAKLQDVETTPLDNGLEPVPREPLPPIGTLGFRVQRYGMTQWSDLFTARQRLALSALARHTLRYDSRASRAVLALGKLADLSNALCTWIPEVECPSAVFKLGRVKAGWDFIEGAPFRDSSGSYAVCVDNLIAGVQSALVEGFSGHAEQQRAQASSLPSESAAVWFTDPPYYDAIPYSDLSDFFLVWLRRALPDELRVPDPFDPSNPLSPKIDEAVHDETKQVNGKPKDRSFFESTMALAFAEGRRILHEDGIGSVVFAHKSTEGWEALLSGMIRGRLTITASWPITTEMGHRIRARESAALAASIHLVCRPRDDNAGIGDWGDIVRELPKRIGDWMERLSGEGIRGADLVFACIGPALELFSKYARVETPDGEEVGLAANDKARGEPARRGFLSYVWEFAGRTALNQVLGSAESRARNGAAGALEEDARLTALFLWTLQATEAAATSKAAKKAAKAEAEEADAEDDDDEAGDEEADGDARTSKGKGKKKAGLTLIYDVARRFAQPLGIHLDLWEGRIIETSKGVVRLLPVGERAKQLFGEEGASAVVRKFEAARKPDPQGMLDFMNEQAAAVPEVRGRGRKKKAGAGASAESLRTKREATTLDRIHAAMLLQASGATNALRAMLEAETQRGPDFLRLANALSALYPRDSEEKRLLDAMLLAVPR